VSSGLNSSQLYQAFPVREEIITGFGINGSRLHYIINNGKMKTCQNLAAIKFFEDKKIL